MRIKINKNLYLYSNNSNFVIDLKKGNILIIEVIPTIEYYTYFQGGYEFRIRREDADEIDGLGNLINLTNNKSMNKFMNIKEKFILALTKEPQKSFRKAGITNGDDILTEDGEKVFMSWLLHTVYADQFKKEVVQDMLDEQKKEEEK